MLPCVTEDPVGALLHQLFAVADALLATAEGTPDETRALEGIARLRSASSRGQPDVAAVGGWAASYHGGTLHATRGLLVVRGDPVVTLDVEHVEELRELIQRDRDFAEGEVELWLVSHPLFLKHLQSDGIRVEHVAALIVAAIRELTWEQR